LVFIVQSGLILLLWTMKSDHEKIYHDNLLKEKLEARKKHDDKSHDKSKEKPTEKPLSDPERFTVNNRGAWEGMGSTKGHLFDDTFANVLVDFFRAENAQTVLDLGTGIGNYSQVFMKNGLFVTCYDGNPSTQDLSDGRCGILDLSKVVDITPHDWVLSLEVGEHIPPQFEDVFIQTLNKVNKKGLIVSWAVEGQGGTAHVNCRNNPYIKERFAKMGYISDEETQTDLRSKVRFPWFKNTLMVFRRPLLL